ncbi:MAG: hypothetical protein IPN76_31735 [Saprospiraceae bacterium]|nr:hypothetical protein [Saprospiraceae bacterium]
MRKPFLSSLSVIFLFALSAMVFFTACKDESDDFTSGNFYPIDPNEENPEEPGDSTVVVPSGCWKPDFSVFGH